MPVVAKVLDLPNMGKKLVELDGQQVLLINDKGSIYAVDGECPHQGAPLLAAIVKDGFISCPRHGYRFGLKDGVCKEHPDFVLKSWPVRVEGDDILVDLA